MCSFFLFFYKTCMPATQTSQQWRHEGEDNVKVKQNHARLHRRRTANGASCRDDACVPQTGRRRGSERDSLLHLLSPSPPPPPRPPLPPLASTAHVPWCCLAWLCPPLFHIGSHFARHGGRRGVVALSAGGEEGEGGGQVRYSRVLTRKGGQKKEEEGRTKRKMERIDDATTRLAAAKPQTKTNGGR